MFYKCDYTKHIAYQILYTSTHSHTYTHRMILQFIENAYYLLMSFSLYFLKYSHLYKFFQLKYLAHKTLINYAKMNYRKDEQKISLALPAPVHVQFIVNLLPTPQRKLLFLISKL